MKKVFLALGIIALIGGALLIVVLFKAAGVVREAHGRALYSSVGAWTRIHEFAEAKGKTNYLAEADNKLALLEHDLKMWRENAQAAHVDLTAFEKMRSTAYETTDRNIKNGQNPLAYLDGP